MKEELRRLARRLSKTINPDWHTEASASVCSRLYEYLCSQDYKSIGLYMPMADEVDIYPLLRRLMAEGKEIYLPRVMEDDGLAFVLYREGDELELSRAFQLKEPKLESGHREQALDILLVPAVHFYQHYRLGRGKGYYDRYLALYRPGKIIGVSLGLLGGAAFVPAPWDIPMDIVFTR